jgi:Sulfotransferase family
LADERLGAVIARGWRKVRRQQLSAHGGRPSLSAVFGATPEALLERAYGFYGQAAHAQDANNSKMEEDVRRFDVQHMDNVLAICRWGSSGSLLLLSYFDGHDEAILIPGNLGSGIYPFFDGHRSLSLEQKLLAYPLASVDGFDNSEYYFRGEHAIDPARYHAAVSALMAVNRDQPPQFLESRRTFFQLLHIAYCVALGRLPSTPRPVIVYMQALANDVMAQYLLEDFAQARFIHTVRDPITNVGRLFEHDIRYHGTLAPVYVLARLTFGDRAQRGTESASRAIRFEDLHLHLEETMQALVAWIGITYRPVLLESTVNGQPYIWRATSGASWTGKRPEKAQRTSQNVSFIDRCLLFALFNEDFVAWNYPCSKIFGYAPVRVLSGLLVLIPTKMEAAVVIPILKSRSARSVLSGFAKLCIGRLAIVVLVLRDLFRRVIAGKRLLTLLPLAAPRQEGTRLSLGRQTQ